jgi:undecaprenyl-diphosphatase
MLSAAVVGYLLLIHKPALAVVVVVSALGGTLLSTLLKMGFDRPRPDIESSARVFTASFPSGHATVSAVVFLTLGALLSRGGARRRVKSYFVGLAVFLTILVGLSRIYLGVHYPSDVLAASLIGAGLAGISLWLLPGVGLQG